jgi:hypothetical protein
MSTAIATTSVNTSAAAGFLESAGKTVMNWLRALLSATPAALAASHGSASQESIASYYKVGYRMALLRRANEVEAEAPAQAAELRKLARAA